MQVAQFSPQLTALGFRHGFSLRSGGVSQAPFESLNLARSVGDDADAVRENHARFAHATGYSPEALWEVSQVHGARVCEPDPARSPAAFRAAEAADALLATQPGTTIGVRVADCIPLLIADPQSGAVAAVHAGWRGVVAGVVTAALDALSARVGTPRDQWRVAIGPHIGGCCFEVGDAVAAELAGASRLGAGVVVSRRPKPRVALLAVVREQLAAAEVADSHVDVVSGCTACEPVRYFSFRRDGPRSGRHLAVITARV